MRYVCEIYMKWQNYFKHANSNVTCESAVC